MNVEIDTPDVSLREILDNLRSTDRLDKHPWVESLFVQEFIAENPGLESSNGGYQLGRAVADIFARNMPGSPPKRGKRLDTQWGAFGILAAQYFAPFVFGSPFPGTFRDAWGKIDEAILLFRFGKENIESLTSDQKSKYRLVGDELDITPISTISDWHRKGISELYSAVVDREKYLSQVPSHSPLKEAKGEDSAAVLKASQQVDSPNHQIQERKRPPRWVGWFFALAALAILVFAGIKGWRVYRLVDQVQGDLDSVMSLASMSMDEMNLSDTGPLLEKLHTDFENLHAEAYPYARTFGPLFRWVPGYGQDLADSAEILDLGYEISSVLKTTYDAGAPLLTIYQSNSRSLNPREITAQLVLAQPLVAQAREDLDSVFAKLEKLEVGNYSYRVQSLLTKIDRPLKMLDTGLSLAVALPKVLGASSDGPKTYLLLIQNEDELRPTGGFITSVGTVVVKDGELFGLAFEDTDGMVNWSLPYPAAPWQLRTYMNSPVLILRDANWFPDYPTSVSWIEFLYAYDNQHSVDGVIAIDQQMLVNLLQVIGPITIPDADEPITSENVISYMQAAKTPPIQPQPKNWTRKAFISQIGNAIMDKVISDSGDIDWRKMFEMGLRTLNERHLLLQFDDPSVTRILAEYGWDGSVSPGDGDYLMVVDSNIGFNKANAAVETRMMYDIDLTDPAVPTGKLIIYQTNQSPNTRSCIQYGGSIPEESRYPIYYCYYNYLRVYVPSENTLVNATPHRIPADWMILKQSVDAQVDALDDPVPGIQGYGTLIVVPGGQTIETGFDFSLPAQVIKRDQESGVFTYSLKIQKQPGTKAIPMVIRIHLPPSARLGSSKPNAVVDGSNLLFETDLSTDIHLTVEYSLP